MKNKYIQSLLHEIQLLESKVAGLKDNQTVSFSFFKEAFRHTQEIMRLLHTLEFVQIEDMKSQMEKLVQFLSEASEEASEQTELSELPENENKKSDEEHQSPASDNEQKGVSVKAAPSSAQNISKVAIKEDFPLFDKKGDEKKPAPPTSESKPKQETDFVKESATENSLIHPLHSASKSLNDMQPTSHTIMDSKRSISLNDRFLFQRELFNNDRHAMNSMLTKMEAFATFAERKNYLENNTHWDFKDETVQKFLGLLKEGF